MWRVPVLLTNVEVKNLNFFKVENQYMHPRVIQRELTPVKYQFCRRVNNSILTVPDNNTTILFY